MKLIEVPFITLDHTFTESANTQYAELIRQTFVMSAWCYVAKTKMLASSHVGLLSPVNPILGMLEEAPH